MQLAISIYVKKKEILFFLNNSHESLRTESDFASLALFNNNNSYHIGKNGIIFDRTQKKIFNLSKTIKKNNF